MLLMIESEIRGNICHSVLCNAKINNKYMNNYNKNRESLYISYLERNNLYLNECKTDYINEDFVKIL